MKFTKQERRLSEDDIFHAEDEVGIDFPGPLRDLYRETNGGYPSRYIYRDEEVETVVAQLLPLRAEGTRGTSVKSYTRLVVRLELVPAHFFPFAVDGGGDYFFIDCESSNGVVYLYQADNDDSRRFRCLGVGVAEFWGALTTEEGQE